MYQVKKNRGLSVLLFQACLRGKKSSSCASDLTQGTVLHIVNMTSHASFVSNPNSYMMYTILNVSIESCVC